MKQVLAVLMIVVFAFGATACSSASGDIAAARVQRQQMYAGGPN